MQTQKQRLGADGERAAAAFLAGQHYEILDRNWRCPAGELDLVARAGNGQIVAVEVKTRSSQRFGSGFDAITPAKFRRLNKLLLFWARSHRLFLPELRVDVVEVYATATGFDCNLHENVHS
ncbi:YraN family protein [Glutamicibacter nicotianae]|uniref:YraN family protein n=1 Tax=Glutamicibacter nicotianae TaxID=37929 RepID=UPI00167F4B5E|nr:YraN family protein [Glutamicibacter nicotianae]